MGQPSSSSPTPSQQSVTAPRSHDDPTSAGPGRDHRALTWLSWHRRLRRDPINEEWRIASLHHAEGTDIDRPHLPTMPGLTTKVRPRVRSALRLVYIKSPPEGNKGGLPLSFSDYISYHISRGTDLIVGGATSGAPTSTRSSCRTPRELPNKSISRYTFEQEYPETHI
ncbi:hypothetical protein BHM03_00034429 [Ensete ventricosum]|nr:hypothetical protein BHM03_00034429 [Ensete ventricosum]